jgi:drug/metabolite transporter superfamily protein YnfA
MVGFHKVGKCRNVVGSRALFIYIFSLNFLCEEFMNYVIWTYVLRAIALVMILLGLFPSFLYRWLPGLESQNVTSALFVAGAVLFIVAAVSYAVLRKKELAEREQEYDDKP